MKGKRVDNHMKEKEKKIHQRIKRLNVLIMESRTHDCGLFLF